jgi:hypothetical protein
MEFERQDVGDKARLLDVPERVRRMGMKISICRQSAWATRLSEFKGNHPDGAEVRLWPWWKQIYIWKHEIEHAPKSLYKTLRVWFYTRLIGFHVDITTKR